MLLFCVRHYTHAHNHASTQRYIGTRPNSNNFYLCVQKRSLLIEGGEELANTLKPPDFMVEKMQAEAKKAAAPRKVALELPCTHVVTS